MIKLEETLKKIPKNSFLPIIIISSIGFIIRVYFTPWGLPSAAADTFVFMLEGIQYSIGEIGQFNPRFLWPFFVSIFFIFLNFDEYLGYINVMRILSISVSVASITILYLISKYFVEKKWAFVAAFLFAIEPNIIENSTWAIKEPLFIFLGLLSFYFILNKNERLAPFAFITAGLAFDTAITGIGIFLTIFFVCFFKFKNKSKLLKNLIIGIILFLVVSFPHISSAVEDEKIPILHNLQGFGFLITQEKESTSSFISADTPTTENILKNILIKEILHFGRIMVPFLLILAPIGFILTMKEFDFYLKSLILSVIITFAVAFPMYTLSAEFRNLFFITPMLCILGAITIQKINQKNKKGNSIMLLIFILLIFSSIIFLHFKMEIDEEFEHEKNRFGKYIVNNYSGKVMGDLYNIISFYVPNAKIGELEEDDNISNENFGIVVSEYPLDSEIKLKEYTINRKIDYLVIDDNYDKRYPIFKEIFTNESNFSYLKKQFDSTENGYTKLNVKIFKINYEKFDEFYNNSITIEK